MCNIAFLLGGYDITNIENHYTKDREGIIVNILVVGNGFDLAHGLPTDYGSFLKLLNLLRLINGDRWIARAGCHPKFC